MEDLGFRKPEPLRLVDDGRQAQQLQQHVHKPWKSRAGRFAPQPVESVLAAVFLPPPATQAKKETRQAESIPFHSPRASLALD